jgi:signal transduction histidine kinase
MMRMQSALVKRVREQVQTEKMVALGQLSAGIAHEIRNPLFALRNDLDFLQRRANGDAQQEEVHRSMDEGLSRIGDLVNAVLDYSRPHRPEFGRHTVEEVLARCTAMTGKQLAKQHVTLEVQLEADMPPIEMDIHALEQVFVNLLTNAMNARRGPEGHVHITARTLPDAVEVEIADDGVGIEQDDVSRIFDPFFTRSSGGTGLGLTIVHRIVDQHHGTIEVQSERGRGTTFTLHLPRVQPKQDAA